MSRGIEFLLILSQILGGIAVYFLAGLLFVGSFLYNRLDRPNYIKRMRSLCAVFMISVILLVIFKSIQIAGLFANTRFYTQPSVLRIIIDWAVVVWFVFLYFKLCRYYLIHRDDKTVMTGWYIKKHLSLCKKKKYAEAFSFLQKASELKTNSVFIWSMMATLNERCFDKPGLSDEYLAKAHEILNKSNNPSLQDQAIVESVTGDILLSRNHIDEGLAHLKTACDLDPSDFYKEKYERALKWATKDDESENSV